MQAQQERGLFGRLVRTSGRRFLGVVWALGMATALAIGLVALDAGALPLLAPFLIMALAGLLWAFIPGRHATVSPFQGPVWPWSLAALSAGAIQGGLGPVLVWCLMPGAAGLFASRRPLTAFVPAFLSLAVLAGLTVVHATAPASNGPPGAALSAISLLTTLAAFAAAILWAPIPDTDAAPHSAVPHPQLHWMVLLTPRRLRIAWLQRRPSPSATELLILRRAELPHQPGRGRRAWTVTAIVLPVFVLATFYLAAHPF